MTCCKPHLTRITTLFVLLTSGLCYPLTLFASDTSAEVSAQDLFAELPIVLSASRLPQSAQDAPVATTTIDRDLIEASGAINIPDLLRLVPGFLVDYDSGHIQAVSYHMLENRFVRQQQVLIDGRSVYSPLVGGIPWTELPITIDDIERIEVVRGANAATYGSNSFLGVINIITKEAVLDNGTAVKANIGNHNLREGFLRHGSKVDKLDYSINLAYRENDGFDERFDSSIVRLINTRLDYQMNTRDNLTFHAGYSEGPRQEDNTLDSGIPNHTRESYYQYQQIKWQRTQTSEENYYLQIYHNQQNDNKTYTRTDIPLAFDESDVNERYDIEFQQTLKPLDSLRLVWGASFRRDSVYNPLYFGTTQTLYNDITRLFTHGEYRFSPETLINVGVMLEDNAVSGSDLSPRVSLNQKISANNTLRISYSQANRAPVMFEQYPDTKIETPVYDQILYNNGDLANERITEYDIGLVGQSADRAFSYDAKLFYQDIKGLISTETLRPFPDYDNGTLVWGNFDDAKITGFETGIDWRWTPRSRLHGSYAHIDIDSSDNHGDYSNAAPADMFSILALHHFDNGVSASTTIYYRSSMKPLARRALDPVTIPSYTRTDVRVAKDFGSAKLKQQIALVGQNIFNAQYDTVLNNAPEQTFYISYTIKFE